MHEIPCAVCGSPLEVRTTSGITLLLCDDLCRGVYWARRPHHLRGFSGPMCGEGGKFCGLHQHFAVTPAPPEPDPWVAPSPKANNYGDEYYCNPCDWRGHGRESYESHLLTHFQTSNAISTAGVKSTEVLEACRWHIKEACMRYATLRVTDPAFWTAE